jgi:hypothetical protein
MSVENFTQVEAESTAEMETKTEQPKEKEKKESKLKQELRQWQKQTIDSYKKASLELPEFVDSKLNSKNQLNDFLRRANEQQATIQKIIQTMKRIPKLTYDKDGKAVKKDYLEVNSTLHAKSWEGNTLAPVIDYFEGYHYEPEFTTTYRRDMETGDMVASKTFGGDKKVYDIELTDKNRKQIVSDIINNSLGSSIEQIKFYYQVPDSLRGAGHRDGNYTYDQFINSSLEEMENIAWTRPIPAHLAKDNKSYHG